MVISDSIRTCARNGSDFARIRQIVEGGYLSGESVVEAASLQEEALERECALGKVEGVPYQTVMTMVDMVERKIRRTRERVAAKETV